MRMEALLGGGQLRTVIRDGQQALDFRTNQVQNRLLVQLWQGDQRRDISGHALHLKEIVKIGTQGGQLAHDAALMVSKHLLLLYGFADAGIFVVQG